MTPRSIRTLEQLRSEAADLATALDSATFRLWVTALDDVLVEVGGSPLSGGDDDGAWQRLVAATPVVEGVSASDDTSGTAGFGGGTPAKADPDGESGEGPEPLLPTEREELDRLEREHYSNSLGDRPHSMAALKLSRMLALRRRATETS